MFVGREEQLRQLNALWRKRVSSLVTCRGRRRIGKNTLIERFAQKSGARFIAEVDEKVKRIARPSGVSMRTALVYDGELAPTVEACGYFDAIIPARRLLGL